MNERQGSEPDSHSDDNHGAKRGSEKWQPPVPPSSEQYQGGTWNPPPIIPPPGELDSEPRSLRPVLVPIVISALIIVAIVAAANWRRLSQEVARTVARPVQRPIASPASIAPHTPPAAAPRVEATPQIQPTAELAPRLAATGTTPSNAQPMASPPPAQTAPPEPWLGLRVQTLHGNEIYQKLFKGVDEGVVVQMVEPASRAAESDLWNADVITHFDGVPVASDGDVQHEVFKRKPGDTIELTVWRNNRVLKIPVRVSERSRRFAGKWGGLDHQFKFGDQTGNSDYRQTDSSPLEIEVSDDEGHLTTKNPELPPMPEANIPNTVPDWWYHQESRTLASVNDPQYQINLLGDGNTALLKRTPYKDQIDSSPVLKGFLTTSRALLKRKAGSGGDRDNVVDVKSDGQTKAEATLSSNQTVPGEAVLLRIRLGGTDRFTLPGRITVDGLEIEPCGIASPEVDPAVENGGVVYEYAILPLRAGRFTIPSQTISTQEQRFQTAALELSVRSGRPELPTFKEWLNRDALGNLLPPRKTVAMQPRTETSTEPMKYKLSGSQKLSRAVVSPFGFSVMIPIDVFPNAVDILRRSNILLPPNTASPSVIYLPPRPASSFDATYTRMAADASPSEPMKVVHYRNRKDNTFIVQYGNAEFGVYMAGFRKDDNLYLMDVEYHEQDCPFTAETLKAMADSFLANENKTETIEPTAAPPSPNPKRLFAGIWEGNYYVFGNAPAQRARVTVDESETVVTPPLYTGPPLKGWRKTGTRTLSLTIGSGKGARHDYFVVHEDGKTADYKMQLAPGLSQHGTFRKKQ